MKHPSRTGKSIAWRGKQGTLVIIGTLMLLSAAVRLATEAGQAIASEDAAAEPMQETSMDLSRPDTLTAALKAIKDREALLIAREAEIEEREAMLTAAERAIDAELEELERAETSLRQTISLAASAAEEDLSQLTSVYANMKPKQAAALFEQMDPTFAAGFLGRMAAESAARIMAGMTAEKAYEISVELAGRNADIPLE